MMYIMRHKKTPFRHKRNICDTRGKLYSAGIRSSLLCGLAHPYIFYNAYAYHVG